MKKEVKHRDTLNQRQKQFTSQMVKNGGNKTQALLSAGYSPAYANSDGKQLLLNPTVKQDYERKIIKAYKKAGIDDDMLARITQEGLEANKVFTFQGEVIKPKEPVPDHFIRQKFLETAKKVRGDFAPEQHEHSLKRETAEEAFRQRVQKRQELEAKAGGNGEKPVEVCAEVVDDSTEDPLNVSEVTHKKGEKNEGG